MPRHGQPWMPSGWVRLCKRFGLRSPSKDESEIAGAVPAGPYEQEQLFVETVVPLPQVGLADVEAFFLQARARPRQR